jgi:hypothetical protein
VAVDRALVKHCKRESCDNPVIQEARGRTKHFCSTACRQKYVPELRRQTLNIIEGREPDDDGASGPPPTRGRRARNVLTEERRLGG